MNATIASSVGFAQELAERMGVLFYLVRPIIYEDVHKVPNFMHRSWPQLTFLFAIEVVIRYMQGRKAVHYNEVIMHSGALMFAYIFRYLQYSCMLYVFEHIYTNYRLITLSNHWRVWFFSLLLMEFMFYCAHRLLHEVNFLWASHQYHHSCKNFNIGTAVRLSWFELNIVYYYTSLLALVVPPPIMITHMQYMFLYQAWLHTETVGKLGFLELVLNTPSHHRVHHAKNRNYIDKNFGAYLIIFDRLFGTYAEEDEQVVYGITTRVRGHNIIHQQFYYYTLINRKINKSSKLRHKLLAIFAGPGWRPGAPRLGFRHEIPDAYPEEVPRLDLPLWQVTYTSFTCIITLIGFYLFANHSQVFHSWIKLSIGMSYIIITFTAIAAIYDKRYDLFLAVHHLKTIPDRRPFVAFVHFLHGIFYYVLEIYVFPWTPYSGDIYLYLRQFFRICEPLCMSSILFAVFRWYNTTAAIVWLTIIFSKLKSNEKSGESDSNYTNDLIVVKNHKPQNKYAFETLILNTMLSALVISMVWCSWFEYFYPHMM